MKIVLLVLNYNGIKDSLECIESLKNLKTKKFTVSTVVVDNASTDGSQEKLRKISGIKLLENKKNLGYSGGNNVGIKYAINSGADYVCILNNDVKVDKNLLVNFLKSTNTDIVSPKIYFYPGQEFHKSRYKKQDIGKVFWYAGGYIDWDNIIGSHRGVDEVDSGQFDSETLIGYATGACIFANVEVFKKVGLFDEKYFLYLEDMDFSIRAKKAGYKITYQPSAIVWHKNASSSGGSGSQLQDYYISRNRLLFAFKYAKIKTKLALLKQISNQYRDPVKRQALLDFLSLKFGNRFKAQT